jgi:RNA polymerase sigma-70 factor (ECF subfamily)
MRQQGGFEKFYEANYGRVVALAAAMLGDRHQAEDVAQEAFTRALARWPAVGRYDLPEAWVRRVALRLAVDAARRIQRAKRFSALLAAARREPPNESGDLLASTALTQALLRVPLHQREVLLLHYLADLPVEAIARDCGLPAGTVKTRLAAGRRRLERELTECPEAVRDAG